MWAPACQRETESLRWGSQADTCASPPGKAGHHPVPPEIKPEGAHRTRGPRVQEAQPESGWKETSERPGLRAMLENGRLTPSGQWKIDKTGRIEKMPRCGKVQAIPCASLRTVLYLKGEDAQLERLDSVWPPRGACVDADLLWWVVRFCRERAWFEEMRTAVCRAGGSGVLCLQFALERFRKRIMNGAEGWRLATGNMGYMEVLSVVLETLL